MQSSVPGAQSFVPRDTAGLQHGRYKLEHLLGQGGMALVYQARDLTTGRELALKRLRPQNAEKQALVGLFAREFLALSELKHPRIVEVYDYHLDEDGPYYTMELLEGGDVQRIAPVDYRTACALAYDICSALSLVHSRRMVFRDLSPNNIRRTGDGLAKLIDFGALAPMGPSRDIVGTLPCVAPEAVGFAPLDARTDLFALGATLYFALTRRHGYPGRSVEELVEIWRRPLLKPSELVAGIPPALDQLILELLQLDPERRPSAAGEVMERLSAIAGLTPHEELLVKQAYLATPAMVGRESALEAVRAQLGSAKQNFGSSLCLQGPPGIGRSRMLEACGLEAKRLGMVVLRADGRDAQQGDYGVVRALARSLLTQAPTLARKVAEPHRGYLGRLVPELRTGASEAPSAQEDPQDLHRHLQPLLRQWFCEVSARCPLLLAIDDLERIDPPSAAFVSLMARDAQRQSILLLTGQATGAASNALIQEALHVYARYSTGVPLEPLESVLTEKLLGSLFGEVPNISLLAHHVQRITKGNPRDVLRLSEHLVSENVIGYQAGTWSIPERLSTQDLPSSMAHALEQRVGRLSPSSRLLCYGLSCEPRWVFTFEECAHLLNEAQPALVMKCLNELVASEFVQQVGDAYAIADSVVGSPLDQRMDNGSLQALHLNLAGICAERQDMFRSARHLLRAGREDAGLSAMIEFVITSVKKTDTDAKAYNELLTGLPSDWIHTFEVALTLCDRLRRPAREKRAIMLRFGGLAVVEGPRSKGLPHLLTLLDQLSYEAGLDCFADLPPSEDPKARIQVALARAAARYHATSEHERVSDPGSAIAELAKTMVAAMGLIAYSSSHTDWERLPSLLPLCPLSPTVALVQALCEGIGLRIGGYCEASIAVYRRVLDRLNQPDRGGLPASHHRHTQMRMMGTVGALEAAAGKSSSLEWVAKIAEEPRFESMALTVKQLYQLFQGDLREAKRTKQQVEQIRLESNAHNAPEAQHMFLELNACALAQDMTGVKRALDALAPYETPNVEFRAAAHYGRCEYHRMRGDAPRALAEIEAALTLMQAARHLLWVYAASAHVRVMLELGQVERACTQGEAYLRQADTLGYSRNHVRAALSLALLRKGDHAAAIKLADSAVDELRAAGVTGLHLAQMCEARAQIAAAVGDSAAYEQYAALYSAQWRGSGRRLQKGAQAPQPEDLMSDDDALNELRSTWETCHTIGERLHAGLEALARQMGALSGVLYARTNAGLVRGASVGESAKDTRLDVWATDYFTREVTHYETEELPPTAVTLPPRMAPRASVPELAEYEAVLLGHNDPQGYLLTGVVVLVGPKQKRPGPREALASELSRCVSGLEHVVPEYL